jgi:hypothetical protein
VDPKPSTPGMLLAPPPTGSAAVAYFPGGGSRPPSSRADLPSLDEHVVKPETREEMVRGRRVLAMPAKPEHGDQHFKLDYVIGAHVKEGYVGSTDMLTRLSHGSDFATDTCVRRQGKDEKTGERYLEELAFEVVNEQSLRDMTARAEDLTARGVRRVVAIFVKEGEVREWSTAAGSFQRLDPQGTFSDPVLARPLHVKDLIDAAEADNAVARALLAKNNRVLVEMQQESRRDGIAEGRRDGIAEGRRDGIAEGRREAIELACELLGIELTEARQSHVGSLDAAGLEALLSQIRALRRWP